VEFAVLPPASGRLPRAIEISTLPRRKPNRPGEIAAIVEGNVLRLVLIDGNRRSDLGELQLEFVE
jgi:hypothetical protein